MTSSMTGFGDSKQTNKIAEESIILLDKSISPDDMDQGDPNESYKLTESRPHIKENVVIRTTISNGVPGTTVYFSVDGKGIDKDDLDLNYGRLKGEAVIQDKGEAVIPFLFRADHKTEGEEKATVTIYEDKQRKKVLNKVSFPVIDTSIQTPDQSPTKSVEPAYRPG